MFVVLSPDSISILWPEVNFHFEYNVQSNPREKSSDLYVIRLPMPPMFARWMIAFDTGAENWIVTTETFEQTIFGSDGFGYLTPQRGLALQVQVTPLVSATELGENARAEFVKLVALHAALALVARSAQ